MVSSKHDTVLGSKKAQRFTVELYGETYSYQIQPIRFENGENDGSWQVLANGKLDGFVLPSGVQTENAYSLGNVVFEVCEASAKHVQTLDRFLVEDFTNEQVRSLA